MSRAIVRKASGPIQASFELPGDKSVCHRRALFTLFLQDEIRLSNFSTGEDCLTTLACLEKLGRKVLRNGTNVIISGGGIRSGVELDCGNSGTTARLLMGILAGHSGKWMLHGDASLSRRPMERVAVPLRKMDCDIELMEGHLPARIEGAQLDGISYEAPVASAQLKSAVLAAGLKATGQTRYREPHATRDHTERLLGLVKAPDGWLTLNPEDVILNDDWLSSRVPGDISTASFWIAAAMLLPGSQVRLPNTLVSPTRIAHLQMLHAHGAAIEFKNETVEHGEAVATVVCEHKPLAAFKISEEHAPLMVDEIPALAVIATAANGRSEFHGLGELRVKESDRYALMVEGLQSMGAVIETWDDGFAVNGPVQLKGAKIETAGDHRIAMAFAVAGLAAEGETIIEDAESVAVSYSQFWKMLEQLVPGSHTLEG